MPCSTFLRKALPLFTQRMLSKPATSAVPQRSPLSCPSVNTPRSHVMMSQSSSRLSLTALALYYNFLVLPHSEAAQAAAIPSVPSHAYHWGFKTRRL